MVVMDSRKKRDSGSYKEILGIYDPMREKAEFSAPLIVKWLLRGARPTFACKMMLMKANIVNYKGELLDLAYAAELAQSTS